MKIEIDERIEGWEKGTQNNQIWFLNHIWLFKREGMEGIEKIII